MKRRFGRRFDSRSTPAVTTVVAATLLQRRSPTHRRQSSDNCRSAIASASARRTAGSRPPPLALRDTTVFECVRNRAATRFSTARRTHTHRSWCVCVCASQKSQFRRRANAPEQERGGVSPPVVTRPRLQRRTPTRRATVFRRVAVAPLQVRFATHGGLTPAAPGARGSLTAEKATFAMHESIFAGTRAGGVSPPWRYGNAHALQDALSDGGTRTREQETGRHPPRLHERDCNSVRQHAGDSLPNSGGSAFASASA